MGFHSQTHASFLKKQKTVLWYVLPNNYIFANIDFKKLIIKCNVNQNFHNIIASLLHLAHLRNQNVAVSISGNTILSQNMDLSVVPSGIDLLLFSYLKVCGTYYGCDICVEINPNPNNANQRCVQIQPTVAFVFIRLISSALVLVLLQPPSDVFLIQCLLICLPANLVS